jgi:hypothetical protein
VRLLAALILLLAGAASPNIRYFQYERPIQNVPQQPAQACLVLDPTIFAHSSIGLSDLRLYRDRTETPYLIQTSAPISAPTEQTIAALNLGSRGGKVVFDAAMPTGAYADLQLKIAARDFIATVAVTGSQHQTGPATKIGAYTVFDLTRQRLGRSTVLHLPTSDFHFLHFMVSGLLKPEEISGLAVQQASAAKPAYVTVAETSQIAHKGHSTLIELTVPAHVPVDRITITPPSAPSNFSRDAIIAAAEISTTPASEGSLPPQSYTSSGNLLRVHVIQDDHRIDQENLQLDSPHEVFENPAKWTISIDNGDDAPLLPTSVRLEMFERDICFQSSPGNYMLYFGDPALSEPRYDIGQFLVIHPTTAAHVSAAPEQQNPELQPRPDERPFTEKHPALLWIALSLVILLLGIIALRSAHSQQPPAGNA